MKPTPTPEPETYCEVCQRVKWGNWQPLGFNKWRHEECYAGSPAWLEAYPRLKNPTDEQRTIFLCSNSH